MRKLFPVLAALVVLAGCENLDPTQKHDYSCTGSFGAGDAAADGCVQFRLLEQEGNLAEPACQGKSGTWAYHACSTTDQVPGYCQVDSASDYSLSGTPAKVYFYSPLDAAAAEAACTSGGGVWVPPVG